MVCGKLWLAFFYDSSVAPKAKYTHRLTAREIRKVMYYTPSFS